MIRYFVQEGKVVNHQGRAYTAGEEFPAATCEGQRMTELLTIKALQVVDDTPQVKPAPKKTAKTQEEEPSEE